MATIELTKDNLQTSIDDNPILFVDFWADWCQPCKMFAPIFEKASEEHPEIAFAKCDTKAEPEVAAAFGVQSIPTLAVFRDKVLLFMQPGALPATVFEELIAKVVELDMEEVKAQADQAAEQPAGQAPPETGQDAPASGAPAPVPAREDALVQQSSMADRGESGIGHLAGDPVLRRQGVTSGFIEGLRDSGGVDSVSHRVLTKYDRLRTALREADQDEDRAKAIAEVTAWGFDADAELAGLDAETRSELKAVLRAIDELVGG